jgi:oligo-1,6-glucosidase
MRKTWYKEGVVYQIYPRSFKDSNNDGIGDLKGIIEKLGYLQDLGIDIIWISPIYESPLKDNGYDISDYKKIHKDYGTMEDFKLLISELHRRKMKLVMDMVLNHTSEEHPWFIEAKNDINSKYRDYYFFKKGVNGKEPNNWTSFFGGKAWTYNEKTDDYYLHLFAPAQPDVNWDNEELKAEFKEILKFWLDLGVDGFRLDVINVLSKEPGLPNGKKHLALTGKEHYINGPKMHEILQELNNDVFNKYDCFTVGETCLITTKDALTYTGGSKRELDMVFSFEHVSVDTINNKWFLRKFKPLRLKRVLNKYQIELNNQGWNTLFFENHDQPRSVSRWGDVKDYYEESAKLLATILYFQKGTPFIYQGQEIGMQNADFETLDEYQDVETHNIYKLGKELLHFSHKRMMKKIKYMSRDNARTPMQWDDSINSGFSKVKPWLRVNRNYKNINVDKAKKNHTSIYNYYKKIIHLRKKYPVIVYGLFKPLLENDKYIYAYQRTDETNDLIVIANFSKKERKIKLNIDLSNYQLLLNNYQEINNNILKPYEARVYLKK